MSKSFKSTPSKPATSATTTTFVEQPLSFEKNVEYNPWSERKRMEATEAANDFVAMVQRLTHGEPPSNQQMGHALKMSQDVLHRETENPHLNTKARSMLYHLDEMMATFESMLVNKNKDELFQKFWLSSVSAGKELKERSDRTDWAKAVDTRRLESLRSDLLSVSKLVIREPSFRRLLIDMINVLDNMVSVKVADIKSDISKGKSVTSETSKTRKGKVLPAVLGDKSEGSSYATVYSYSDEEYEPTRITEGGEEFRGQRKTALEKTKAAAGQTQRDIHTLLLALSRNREWQRGMTSIFSIINYFQKNIESTGFKANSMPESMMDSLNYGKGIVESFMRTKTLDPLIKRVRNLVVTVQGDQRLKRYFSSIQDLIEKTMTDKHFVQSEGYKKQANKLIDEGRELGNDYYEKLEIKQLLTEARGVIKEIQNDPDLVSLRNTFKNITSDCTRLNSRGRQVLDTDTLGQLREVIAPLIIEQLAYIPIPHIQHRSKSLDWDIDGLVFSAYDVLPENIYFDTNTRTTLKPLTEYQKHLIGDIVGKGRHQAEAVTSAGREKIAQDQSPHEFQQRFNGQFTIILTNIRAVFKDVRFAFRRKAFPKLKDEGLADVTLGGKGCTVTIKVDMDNRDLRHTFFTGGSTTVDVDKLKVHLRKTRHDGFYNFMLKLFSAAISRQIESTIAERISETMSTVVERLNVAARKAPQRLSSGTTIMSYVRTQIAASQR